MYESYENSQHNFITHLCFLENKKYRLETCKKFDSWKISKNSND